MFVNDHLNSLFFACRAYGLDIRQVAGELLSGKIPSNLSPDAEQHLLWNGLIDDLGATPVGISTGAEALNTIAAYSKMFRQLADIQAAWADHVNQALSKASQQLAEKLNASIKDNN